MNEITVVTCFLRNRGEVLLFRRSEEYGTEVEIRDGKGVVTP